MFFERFEANVDRTDQYIIVDWTVKSTKITVKIQYAVASNKFDFYEISDRHQN